MSQEAYTPRMVELREQIHALLVQLNAEVDPEEDVSGEILTDWVIVCALRKYNDDGRITFPRSWWKRDDSDPATILGLLYTGVRAYEADIPTDTDG